jgi:N-acetylglutamate synthase-like GNAT family acetyltransferase
MDFPKVKNVIEAPSVTEPLPNFDFEFQGAPPKFGAMDLPGYQVRRATLDDLPLLTALWQTMKFDTDDLAKRVTEFQLATDNAGKITGAIGLQILQKQGLIHSEAFADFSIADSLRPKLWERVQAVANNHGLLRLWTREEAPFWSRCGLNKPDPEALEKMPLQWKATSSPHWQTLKLREDIDAVLSMDKEFALFMQSEKQRTQRALQQAKLLKGLATLVALALLGLVIFGTLMLLRKNPHVFHH